MQEIMKYLKVHGERLDSEIASGTGLSLANVSRGLSELSAKGEVMMCRLTRFADGKKIEGMLCRVSGYVPPAAPGRKSKAQVKAL
jgi:DNA-binding IclR family transcriptional regulator